MVEVFESLSWDEGDSREVELGEEQSEEAEHWLAFKFLSPACLLPLEGTCLGVTIGQAGAAWGGGGGGGGDGGELQLGGGVL